jgi:LmbE family N-acetylglucosaminyl deacetylase/cytochrome c-type biogenesis protein CcmH/NrfG
MRNPIFQCVIGGLLLAAISISLNADEPGLEALQKAARENPASAQTWDQLGQVLARRRQFIEAQEAFAKALLYAPRSKQILHHMALAYAWSGNYKEAETRYEQLLAKYRQDSAVRLDYGQTLAWDRRFDDARKQYEFVLDRYPEHVDALRHLGLLTAWQGHYDEALVLLNRALKLDVENVDVLLTMSEILSWKGDLAGAADAIRRGLTIAPEEAAMWLKLGQIYLWQGRTRDAQQAYQQAVTLQPSDIEAYLGLSRVYTQNHQYREAEKVLRQALVLFPSDSHLGEKLAALAVDRGLSWNDVMERLEPPLFIVILLTIYYHIWRFRRIIRHHHTVAQALFRLLPVLAALTALLYAFVLLGGAYYREVEMAARVLQLLSLLALVAVFLSLIWLLRFERPQRTQTVLAIGAHPDDIEFGCGATLLRYREEGCRTYALVLTAGEKGMADHESLERVDEAKESARVLALTQISVRDFPDTQLHTCKDAIKNAIEEMVAEIKPDIIFTHTEHDVHSDHRTVFEVTAEAVRGACTILCYENPNTPPGFIPDHFVDITDYLEDKIAALTRHKSQTDKAYTNPAVVRSSAGFRGAQARIKYAEAFKSLRVLEKAL